MNQRIGVALFVGILALLGGAALLVGGSEAPVVQGAGDAAPPLEQRPDALAGTRLSGDRIKKNKVAVRDLADARRLAPGLEPVRMRPPPPPGVQPVAPGEADDAEPDTFSLDPEGVKAAVEQRQADLKACYETALFHSPGLAGTLTLVLDVQPADGQAFAKVASVDVESDLDATVFEGCIATVFEELRFDTATQTEIRYPVKFRDE